MAFRTRAKIARAAYDYDWSSNVNSFEKLGGKIFRHSHAAVGCGISWKVPAVHTNRRPEFHVVRHRRGSEMPTPGNSAARGCIRVDDLPEASTTDPKPRERRSISLLT